MKSSITPTPPIPGAFLSRNKVLLLSIKTFHHQNFHAKHNIKQNMLSKQHAHQSSVSQIPTCHCPVTNIRQHCPVNTELPTIHSSTACLINTCARARVCVCVATFEANLEIIWQYFLE
jgi:hypothetical protein